MKQEKEAKQGTNKKKTTRTLVLAGKCIHFLKGIRHGGKLLLNQTRKTPMMGIYSMDAVLNLSLGNRIPTSSYVYG